jgi:DNA-binding HxlR family transcriptional regulator
VTGKRKYDQACAVAHGLDLIGERWALLVVRDLLLGPKRFSDLQAGMSAASPDVLAQRLRELQQAGVVTRRRLPPPAASWIYELTEWGAQLEPVVTELARWSSRSPSMPYDGPIGVDSLILSLRPLFDPHVAVGVDTRVGIRLDGQDFRVHVADGRLEVSRGEAEFPAATLVTDRATFAALLWRRQRLSEAVKAGSAHVTGDSALLNRFLRMFSLPEPAAAIS